MRLFHGTNCEIEVIDLLKCSPNKDFGKGFYLTDIRKQAEYMALRRVQQAGEGSPHVLEYEFDEQQMSGRELRVKRFEKPSEAWARFILNNRNDKDFTHEYDIVIGPIADDGVALQLRRYTESLISMRTLVRELTYRKLNRQYCFCTGKALSKLIRI
jgi:hypothetical protein